MTKHADRESVAKRLYWLAWQDKPEDWIQVGWDEITDQTSWLQLADAILPLLEDDRRCWGCVEYGTTDTECPCYKRLQAREKFLGEAE